MSENGGELFGGVGKLTSVFESRVTANGTSVAKAEVRLEGDGGWVDVTVWEPATWFAEDWLGQFQVGQYIGIRGKIRERTFTRRDGTEGRRSEITAYGVGPIWEKPR